jgi:hypothetical protein
VAPSSNPSSAKKKKKRKKERKRRKGNVSKVYKTEIKVRFLLSSD